MIAFLVRVLDALANANEQFQPFARRELMFIAVARDGYPGDVLHHEVRSTLRRVTCIQDFSDGRVIH